MRSVVIAADGGGEVNLVTMEFRHQLGEVLGGQLDDKIPEETQLDRTHELDQVGWQVRRCSDSKLVVLTSLGLLRLMNGTMVGMNALLNVLDEVASRSGDRSAFMAPVKQPCLHLSLNQQKSLAQSRFRYSDAFRGLS